MKGLLRKHRNQFLFIMILILQFMVIFIYEDQKQGYHIDELYSYEGAHNVMYYKLGNKNYRLWTMPGWYHAWHTQEEFESHFTVKQEESVFNFEVGEVLSRCFKSRVYYVLLNVMCSLGNGELSKYYGFGLNVILFFFLQSVIYRIGQEIFGSSGKALIPVILYGFSAGAITLVLYIRFYVLFLLCIMLATYLHIRLLSCDKIPLMLLYIAGSALAGYVSFQTQPYTAFYAACMMAVFLFLCIRKRNFKLFGLYLGLSTGGIIFCLLFVYNVSGLLANKNAKASAMAFLYRGFREYLGYLSQYTSYLVRHLVGGKNGLIEIIIVLLLLFIIQLRRKKVNSAISYKINTEKAMMVIMPAIIYFFCMLKVLYIYAFRYMSPVYPAACFVLAITLDFVLEAARVKYRAVVYCVIVGIGLFNAVLDQSVFEIYPEQRQMREVIQAYSDLDSVMVLSDNGNNGFHQLYRDGTLLSKGMDFYITSMEMREQADWENIAERNDTAVLLWLNKYSTENERAGMLKECMENLGYRENDMILETYESYVYCMK